MCLPSPSTFLQTFLVGPKFKGVKMVPPGTHLVAYNSASGQGDFGPTTCFFATLKSGQVREGLRGRCNCNPFAAS